MRNAGIDRKAFLAGTAGILVTIPLSGCGKLMARLANPRASEQDLDAEDGKIEIDPDVSRTVTAASVGDFQDGDGRPMRAIKVSFHLKNDSSRDQVMSTEDVRCYQGGKLLDKVDAWQDGTRLNTTSYDTGAPGYETDTAEFYLAADDATPVRVVIPKDKDDPDGKIASDQEYPIA